MSNTEPHFQIFREQTIGYAQTYDSPYGQKQIIYADWIASGRLYEPIEEKIAQEFGPFVANTHTETSESGTRMTLAYHHAQQIIKQHVNAHENDVLISSGFGMTSVVNKFQRLLGLKSCGQLQSGVCLFAQSEQPVVLISHMEHHSNHTSWYAANVDVVVVPPAENLEFSLSELQKTLEAYKDRKKIIGSFTAASNVTGLKNPVHKIAKLMHQYGGLCFIDYAASAPYVEINMHPKDPSEKLDAILFSPHKFLGGPGTSGILIFDKSLYHNPIPDQPGGGTVEWTNPWGEFKYIDDIETREDGGTPGFLQTIRTALCIRLKEQMGVKNIELRENELITQAIAGLRRIEGIHVFMPEHTDRIGAVSFYHEHIHFNLIVKLLSDRFGVQVRGGCACAGTYGHILLDVDYNTSKNITQKINQGDLSSKPGWVRLSVHPTMTNDELNTVILGVSEIVANYQEWVKDYSYSAKTNEYTFIGKSFKSFDVREWFEL